MVFMVLNYLGMIRGALQVEDNKHEHMIVTQEELTDYLDESWELLQ